MTESTAYAVTYFLVANYRLSRCVFGRFKVILSRISFKFLFGPFSVFRPLHPWLTPSQPLKR